MKKIEFESEDAVKQFISSCVSWDGDLDYDKSVENAKENGYIKKSDLEIARKTYYRKLNDPTKNSIDSYTELVKYKNELEKEIRILKGEK